ncbi:MULTISPECIES: trehalose-phosphatase [Ramlibacter]|uniref:Trehalose 6-phosphate phosphatase n=1 Tax=Ramlibacter pinisoli TaxID=2682844 RepID=A0A6N8J125_9BURK|nr:MULTISPECIES: trehalose-phosphatase [Ramlibacter]MBA2963001.1 trehalose-phosphatase [Ramlibacter sp. CGMCC 1.13660]MVQ32944.1 trehalose-phosphatase [Ramlibacter pinisoli]
MNFVDLLSPACALFLDFDGTLVDIAPEPGAVTVHSSLVPTLGALHQYLGGAVAVVSGRPIAEIDEFLAPLRLPTAGIHGVERRTAADVLVRAAAHPLQAVEAAAMALGAAHPALLIEHKQASIAVHYRRAPELEAVCLATMQDAIDRSPGLTLLRGKMVVEAKPGGASKGLAIEAFLNEPPYAGRVPVFIGDDVTDEAGFSAVQRLGGLGVKVGEGPTIAHQRLADPGALRQAFDTAMATKATARARA